MWALWTRLWNRRQVDLAIQAKMSPFAGGEETPKKEAPTGAEAAIAAGIPVQPLPEGYT